MSSQIIFVEESAAPSVPASGRIALYAKTDSKVYTLDDAGNEKILGDPTAVSVAIAIALG